MKYSGDVVLVNTCFIMIDSVCIENLRSLKNTGFVKLKKLNVLLGSNSSGKSTFLRSFPLISQSIKKNLRGPISWFDDSMVDFGNYETALNFGASSREEKIAFSYLLKAPFFNYDFYGYRSSKSWLFERALDNIKDDIRCKVSFSNDKNGTYIDAIEMSLKQNTCTFSIAKRDDYVSVILNGQQYLIPKTRWIHKTGRYILPSFEQFESENSFASITVKDAVLESIYAELQKYCRKNFTRKERLFSIVLSWSLDKEKFLEMIQSKKSLKSFHDHARKWTVDNEEFLQIYNGILVYFFMNMINVLDAEMTFFYERCGYVAPFRAEASRYYRTQGLQVDDIDPYGRNLQEFISSLTKVQLDDYNSFLEKVLKIKVFVKSSVGHYSIMLNDRGHQVNMTDVGFGYSQVLPILTKLWYAHSKKKLNRYRYSNQYILNNVTLIEQPELHLHPAMQAIVADALVDFMNFVPLLDQHELRDILIVETHSQTIINRIGRRIRENTLSPDDVNVLLFQRDSLNADSEIRIAQFNEKGQLTNWPFGFFDPE